MNDWGRCWLLLVAPVALAACGNASDANPAQASAGGSGLATGQGGQGGAEEAGAGGAASSRGGSSGNSSGGASGSAAAAGTSGGGGDHSGGASGGAGAGAGGASHAADVLMPVVNAFCAAARACCSSENAPAELDDCESSFAQHDATFLALEMGTVTIDQAGLAACLTAYQQAAMKCEEIPVLSACRGLVHGTQKEHEKCLQVGECAHAQGEAVACVVEGQDATEGVCAKVVHGKVGDACLITCNQGDDCSFTSYGAAPSDVVYCFEQDGLFCSSESGHCAAITALGAPCASDDCGSANYCDTTCKKRSGLGEPCTQTCLSSLQCMNNQCLSPSFTVGSTCSGQWFGPY